MPTKSIVAVCTYRQPDTLTQALQSISQSGQFVVSSVNLKNEVDGSTIAAGYHENDLALNGAYTHYMSSAHQLLIFSDCLKEMDDKWGYLLVEAGKMYDEIIIINPDCLSKRKISLADLRQVKMFNQKNVRQEWSLSLISDFVLPSEEVTLAKLTSIQNAKAWQKLMEEKKRQAEFEQKQEEAKKKLNSLIGGNQVSPVTEKCLLDMLLRDRELWGLAILNPDTVAIVSGRSEWGSSGGVGYYSQAVMIFQGQQETKEWCYRDRYDSRKDNWDLCIERIGQIKQEQNGGEVSFGVELLNKDKSRWTEFKFAFKPEPTNIATLSTEDQLAFQNQIEEAIQRLLKIKEERWIGQPEMMQYSEQPRQLMPGESIYTKYQKPALQQKVVHEQIGIATFVLVEQIDHRVSDPQLRYELYCLKFGNKEPTLLSEDHSYDRAEGNAMISIIDLNSQELKVRTRKGVNTISL
ncbi:MAG: hypothetical protein NTX66_00995 [Candidatus Falkowbacteria bacterium]|nr:hypothetical protein [Candidatus Falkowbacteria bacterium]